MSLKEGGKIAENKSSVLSGCFSSFQVFHRRRRVTPLLLILKRHQLELEWKPESHVRVIQMADAQLLLQLLGCIRVVRLADGLLFAEPLCPLSR